MTRTTMSNVRIFAMLSSYLTDFVYYGIHVGLWHDLFSGKLPYSKEIVLGTIECIHSLFCNQRVSQHAVAVTVNQSICSK